MPFYRLVSEGGGQVTAEMEADGAAARSEGLSAAINGLGACLALGGLQLLIGKLCGSR